MKLLIQLVLWIIIIFLGYKLFNSVYEPTKFNEEKQKRYAKVIDVLKDIRTAELAYLEIEGKFTGNFDSLVQFIDTAQFAITQRRDTSYADVERNRAFGLDPQEGGYYIEDIIIDTLSFVPVKDSLFKNSESYKSMDKVTVRDNEVNISLDAGFILRNEKKIAVFEAKASKDEILNGLNRDLIIQEKQTVSVDGVNGSHIIVGSMEDVNTNGNWPKQYDKAGEQ
ncbi:hypothetical protein [Planktosalinus lacus]|uniref:Uncharacterized protein n=1 Tax=Planktosalinus lacus TaxID=1526573 RepID=A0A8J2VCE7_9FLAO|nr:hypothetical protein [Planktosalinus lacus]GGD98151.1 hypothetical protein GCM10011312_22170 [Planktosalinus lacus]